MSHALDYPVAPDDGVEPRIFRAMLIQHMALAYMRAVPDLSLEEGMDAAIATWGTDWDSDPEPRSWDDATDAVHSDLQHWEGD